MKKLASVVLLLALLGVARPASPGPLHLSRTRLAYEQDRDSLTAWTRDGGLDLVWTVGGKPASVYGLSQSEEWYDAALHGTVTLPAGLAPGRYAIDAGDAVAAVDVVQPPKRRATTAATFAAFKTAIGAGFLDVTLKPGVYDWPEMVSLPDWFILRGEGLVTIRRTFVTNYGTNWPALFVGRDVSVYGVRFLYEKPGQVFIYLAPAGGPSLQSGLVVADCVFTANCNFGFFLRDALVRDCRFESAGAVIAPGGLWLRCTFTGPPTQHAWSYWTGQCPVAQVDCTYDGTDRGRVYNTAWGPITDGLFVGTKHRHIMGNVPNGGECDTFEGPGPFDRHVFLHERYQSCSGPLYQWGGNQDGVARGSLIRDLYCDGGLGVVWWGTEVTDHEVREFEFQGCGWYCGPGAKRNRLIDGAFVGFRPTRGNQIWRHPGPLCDKRRVAVWAEGPDAASNTLANVETILVPDGVTPVVGFAGAK